MHILFDFGDGWRKPRNAENREHSHTNDNQQARSNSLSHKISRELLLF